MNKMATKRYNRYKKAQQWIAKTSQPQDSALCYLDQYGYYRYKISHILVHRNIAYHQIYLCNRKKYPLPWKAYVVHHKDGNKHNNQLKNLEILTWNEHAEKHPHLQHHEGEFD